MLTTSADHASTARQVVKNIAQKNGMRLSEQQLPFGEKSRSPAFLLDDGSHQIVVRSAMVDCPPANPPSFEPCFSTTTFTVSIVALDERKAGNIVKLANSVREEARRMGAQADVNPEAAQSFK